MILWNKKKQMIGVIKDGIFRKEVRVSKHLYKNKNAWGIDMTAYKAIREHCTEIRILDKDNNIIYSCTPQDYFSKGEIDNQGHGEQVFLNRDYFNKTKYEKKKK